MHLVVGRARVAVRVIHQQVDPIPLDTDADLVALSFFSGFAPEAYRLARRTYETDGRQVMDATIGGKLRVFEKVEYDSLF